MGKVCFSPFFLFLPVDSFRSGRVASVAILPCALVVERFSLGAWWAFPIQSFGLRPAKTYENHSEARLRRSGKDLLGAMSIQPKRLF